MIKAARAVFAEEGFGSASMTTIAEAVGIRKASLFHHFASKQALYLEVLQETLGELGTLLAEVLAPSDRGFPERLDDLTRKLTQHLGDHPEVARLLYRDLLFGGPFFEGQGSDTVLSTLRGVMAFFEQGMQQGQIPQQDSRQLVMSVLGLHFTFFAADGLRGKLFDEAPAALVAARVDSACVQVRRMCGARAD